MLNRAKGYTLLSFDVLLWNAQLNKLDYFGKTTGPSVLTWSIHGNSHETMKITSIL